MLPYKLPNANGSVVTATSTATTIASLIATAASATVDLPNTVDSVDLMVEGSNSIRILYDGNVPTTSKGIQVKQDRFISLRGIDLGKLYLIATTGTSLVDVQLGTQTINKQGINYIGT